MERPNKNPSNPSKAQNYIKEHQLEPLMSEMLNTLVFHKSRTPEIFLIKYLSSVLTEEERIKNGIHITHSSDKNFGIEPKPLVQYPTDIKNEIVKRVLTRDLWNSVKYTKTKFGATINDVISQSGVITLPDADALQKYKEILKCIIDTLHGIGQTPRHVQKYNLDLNEIFIISHIKFDFVKFAKFEYFRNLKDLPFPHKSSSLNFNEVVLKASLAISHLEKESRIYTVKEYLKYNDNPENFMRVVKENRIHIESSGNRLNSLVLILLNNEIIEQDTDVKQIILLNDISHVRIVTSTVNDSKIHLIYERLSNLHKALDIILQFEFDEHLGYINSDINLLGNGLKFTADINTKRFNESKANYYEDFKLAFNAEVVKDKLNTNNFRVEYKQSLKDSENNFINHIFQKLYNLNNVEENPENAKIENITPIIENREMEKTSEREAKYFNSLKKAYQSTYTLYQFSHFYPHDMNLNEVIQNMSKDTDNKNNFDYFELFPSFFDHFLMNFRNVYDEVIHLRTLINAERNLEDFRESLTNFEIFSLERVKRFNITIRRNIKNISSNNQFNFPHLLTETQKKEIEEMISNYVKSLSHMTSEPFAHDHSTNRFSFHNGQIKIIYNTIDHLSFELNLLEKPHDASALINTFFKTYKEIVNRFEHGLLSHESLGYITNDIRYLGQGLSFVIEIANPDRHSFSLNNSHLRDGFYLESDFAKETIVLGCNLNVNQGICRLFNVIVEMFKSLKVPLFSARGTSLMEPVTEDI